MIETLIGTLFGGAFRMAPEVLKWLDRKDERRHELALLDKNIEADRLKLDASQKLAETQADERITVAELQAMIEGVKAQATQTGIRWVDGLSSLMRPIITFWWAIILYTAALAAQFIVLLDQGQTGIHALLTLWGPEEKAIVSSIMAFWFLDRSLRRK